MPPSPSLNSLPPTLVLEGITKIYPNLRRALDEITISIGTGVFGLLGPNGAGKSSLMEILSGGLAFESGRAILGGKIDLDRHAPEWRRHLGYMPQSFDFVPNMTGREVLEESALLLGLSPARTRDRMDALLERVNLSWAANRDAAGYSRGMKQRLAIAMAILGDPLLLLLDEPTAGLDPEERVFFRELLAEVADTRVVILSSHIVSDIERCCSRVGVIVKGRMLFDGAPSALTASLSQRVWEMPVTTAEIDPLVRSRRLVALTEREARAYARVLSEDAPSPDAVRVEATLEDAYMEALSATGLVLEDA